MYQPLADKVRPKTFKEMIGNEKLIATLDQLLKSDNLVSLTPC